MLAVRAARAAFESAEWSAARPVDRERWLLKLADLLEANAKEFAEIETLDNGKPLVISQRVDVPSAVDFLRYCAGWATKIEGTTVDLSMPAFRKNEFFGYTRREPVGVVGAIIPWNFPLMMAVWKVGPGAGHRLQHRPQARRGHAADGAAAGASARSKPGSPRARSTS